MNCDNYKTATSPRCRKKARVKVVYTKHDTWRANKSFTTIKCWQHYLDLENRARHRGSTFHIVRAEMIE